MASTGVLTATLPPRVRTSFNGLRPLGGSARLMRHSGPIDSGSTPGHTSVTAPKPPQAYVLSTIHADAERTYVPPWALMVVECPVWACYMRCLQLIASLALLNAIMLRDLRSAPRYGQIASDYLPGGPKFMHHSVAMMCLRISLNGGYW